MSLEAIENEVLGEILRRMLVDPSSMVSLENRSRYPQGGRILGICPRT